MNCRIQKPSRYLQDWKHGSTSRFGNVRAYEPMPPPPPAGQREGFDPALFPLKIVKLDFDLNPSKRGWDKFKLSLPPAVRSRHLEDPVYGPDWAELRDFDDKPIGHDLCGNDSFFFTKNTLFIWTPYSEFLFQ